MEYNELMRGFAAGLGVAGLAEQAKEAQAGNKAEGLPFGGALGAGGFMQV